MDTTAVPRLAVKIYQLADDQLFKSARTDGSGWDWSWADWERDWMSATPSRNVYRCLPLTIVNQTGWWIKNPVGFTANWGGSTAPGAIGFQFDSPDVAWPRWISSQFGEGIITWNTPFLFRTEPAGSRLLICGPTNYFRRNAHPLTALIETDWMTMSFTMNYKIMNPNEPVRFEVGEPLFQAIPLVSNVCADLEAAEVRYQKLADDPAMFQAYQDWSTGRTQFHQAKARREVKPDQWQKDYFQGRGASTTHRTKVKPPQILRGPAQPARSVPPEGPAAAARAEDFGDQPETRRRPQIRRRRPEPRRSGPTPGGARTIANPATASPPDPHLASRPSGTQLAACPMGMGRSASLAQPALSKNRPTSEPATREPATARRPATMDDNHRHWIAENLMLESPPQIIYDALVGTGLNHEEVVSEINLALASPYLRGADQLRNRLKKRDWLLATYRRINRLHPEANVIPRRDRLDRAEFLNEYYSTNRPVIITGMMDNWPALSKWNLDFFETHFGERAIEVQFGRNAGENYEIEREKYLKSIRFAEFIALIRSAGTTNDFYLTANNNSSNKQVLPELWNDIVPITEYLDGSDPMSGFFWMGPSGTITPFHHDLTNNFMAQVVGHKKIKIAPSWDMPLMRNDFHVFSKVDGRVTPPQPIAPLDGPQIIECILGPGEILFLPIGCLHYVEGLEVSVTVSFTNFVFPNDFASFYSTYHRV